MNILLTGFMCAGKTTIGRKLAKLLEYSFIDTDTEIEEDQGCSVTDIFKYGGEECFRDMETRQLEKLKSAENSVIATGGGIILRMQNQRMLQKIGKRVYLKVPRAELLKRVKNDL
ncbi:MAG TPA: shikimate kinase, partial [Deltaproteobacteria bacterium]|nr:shikimate kinase [Deltaproteobacteria bacterium]